MRRAWVAAACVAVALGAASAVARADEPASRTDRDPYAAFPMIVPHEKHYLRAVLEIGGVLFVGFVDYLLNTTDRGGTMRAGEERWRLRYDWQVLHDKLVGTGLNLDGNKLATNYVSHPFAGTLYYTAARSNHLSFAESFAFAIVGSTTWEYFGEIREPASVNDLVVTPVSGAAIGEPLMQVASVLSRGRKSFVADAAAFVLAPMKSINEWTEGAQPLRDEPQPWHRFHASVGAGATFQDAAGADRPAAAFADQRMNAELRVANLPGYESAGAHRRIFDDGNLARVRGELALSRGRLAEGLFATRIVPVGYYDRHADADDLGRVRGHGFVVGLRMGFEYGAHDYDRDRARPVDVIGLASPLGIALEHVATSGALQIRTSLDMSAALSAVTSYALTRYADSHAVDDVLTPARQNGYYHAVAISAEPAIEIDYAGFGAGAAVRFDTFHSIRGLDENEPSVAGGPRFSDRRFQASTRVAWSPRATSLRFAVDARRAFRSGSVGNVDDARGETSLWGTLGVAF